MSENTKPFIILQNIPLYTLVSSYFLLLGHKDEPNKCPRPEVTVPTAK
jgi:hypothetical protein